MKHIDPISGMFIVSGVLFAIAEGWALFDKASGNTFSERVWAWIRGKNTTARLTRGMWRASIRVPISEEPITWNHMTWRMWVIGSITLWLFFHLTFGWFRG
jgi:hypothetical protein